MKGRIRHRARAAAACVLGLAVVLGPAGPVSGADKVPIADIFEITIPTDDGGSVARFEGAIHGAYRVPDATVLYWSIRAAEGSDATLSTVFEYDDITLVGGVLADPRSLDVLLPLHDETRCLCTTAEDLDPTQEPTTFQVMYTTFPEVPAGTSTIDVDVDGRGTIIAGVPVSSTLPPGDQKDSATVVMGHGWPAAPTSEQVTEVAAREPQDLVGRSSGKDGAVTTEGTGDDRLVRFDADVLFAFDRSDLSPEARAVLDDAVEEIGSAGELLRVEVVGHTDGRGTADYNQRLSVDRAETVADALRKALGDDLPIDVEGRGWDEPIATNDTEEGRAKNRRVTLSYELKESGR